MALPNIIPQRGFSRKQLAIIGVVFAVLVALYFGVKGNFRSDTKPPEVKLSVWGPLSEKAAFTALFDDYHSVVRQNVTLAYREIDPDRYYDELVDALAAGTGPDIFLLDNRSLPRMAGKVAPLYVGYTYPTMKEPIAFSGVTDLRATFPTTVESDFMGTDGGIYALPLYLDTLALIYNKNSFDQASLTSPPKTWTDVQNYIPYLRELNASGQITKAGAALGGSEATVAHATDIVNLLMLQNGVQMTDPDRTRAFFGHEFGNAEDGVAAFNFYLQFANAASRAYTWNDSQPYSLDAVGSGRVGMVFGYAEDVAALKKKSPFATLGVAPMPQLEGATLAVNYPRYWGFAVSKQTTSTQGWAWDFIVNSTTNPARAKIFTDLTKRPPAIRSSIAALLSDPDLGVFAKQALTARSWYEVDAERISTIMNTAIISVLQGRLDAGKALRQAEDQVTALMNR